MTETAAATANLPTADAAPADLSDSRPFHMRGNYAPVPDELTEYDLPVQGTIPAGLDGWYLRNGSNPRTPTGHWFVGDGMIHGVRIEGGAAKWYRNRWVRTESFEHPFGVYNADGTRNLRSSVANTHVVSHAGRTLALVESSLPYEITNDLQTLGCYDFDGKLNDAMTAHPKICPFLRVRQPFSAARQLSPCRCRWDSDRQPARGSSRADDDARLRHVGRTRRLHGPADRLQSRHRHQRQG